MDDKDLEILEILEQDSRMSDKDIAVSMSLKPEEVGSRIKELKKAGIIKKHSTVIDWKAADRPQVTAYIDLKVVPGERTGFEELANTIASHENVTDVCVASGEYDLVVKVRCNDIDEISKFVTEVLAPKKSIMSTYTRFVLKNFKENGAIMSAKAADDKQIYTP